MTLDEFKKSQKQALKEFKKLSKENPAEAKRIATQRLTDAGILTKSGKIARPYR